MLLCSSAIAFAPRQLGLVLAVASHQQQGLAGQQAVGGSSCVLLYEAALCADARFQWTCTGQIKVGRLMLFAAAASVGV